MSSLANMKIATRMRLILALALGGLLTISLLALFQIKDSMMEARKAKIRNLVEYAVTQLSYYEAQAGAGALTREEAQRQAKESLRKARYDGKEYFWVNDFQPRMVMHAIKPEQEGKDLSDNRDPNGKQLFVEFAKVAKASGAGYVDYMWPKPGETEPSPKISYVKAFEPWGWIVGTGVYIDDINAEFRRNALLLGGASLAILMALVMLGRLLISSILKQLGGEPQDAAAMAGRIAEGNLDTNIELLPGDEHSLLASMKRMQESLARLVGEIRDLVDAASRNGDFSHRIDVAGKQGFGKDIADGLNRLTEVTETGLNDVMRVSRALAEGDLSQHITQPYPGSFGETRDAVNRTVDVLKAFVSEVQQMVDAAAIRGDFSSRINTHDKKGYTKALAEALNKLSEETNSGLHDVMRLASALAEGDLTKKIEADYPGTFGEVATGMNTTVEKLTQLVRTIQDAVNAIRVASGEIATGNQDLSSRTESQASSLEETASSLEELTSTVQQNTRHAREARDRGTAATSTASGANQEVKRSAETMREISEASRRIADITGVIDGIAFQTNILALNAAVEAARAGEQGRGFAVVATEVRTLAQRSATAAKEIKELIGNSLSHVDHGVEEANAAGRTMEEVMTSVTALTNIISEISSASVEQASGIEQINLAVTQMDELTQHNAALVEEAAAAAESLQDQARELAQAVSVFKLNGAPTGMTLPAPRGNKPRASGPSAPIRRLPATSAAEEWSEF